MKGEGNEVRSRAARVAATAPALRAMDGERIAGAIGRAAAAIADPTADVGREARALLPDATGLSEAMVGWALTHQVGIATPDSLTRLARSMQPPREGAVPARGRLCVVVLSGNVFTAALRAIALPLLARVPVVAKASTREDVFPRLLARAIAAADAELGSSLDVVTFPGGTAALEDTLFAQADVVAVYGSDSTLSDVRGRLPATTTFVPHGHGMGAIWVPSDALPDETAATALAERVALDVAAFDQRGCLSPHAVWVGAAARFPARELARLVADHGLARLAGELPRGALPTEIGGAQVQWRGVAAARGELFERDGYAVSFEGPGALRLSPGYRNVSVLECLDEQDLFRRLTPLGMHLKALGVAADVEARRSLAARLPAPLAPRVSAVGTMQTPPIDTLADGHSPFAGLLRWTEVG